MALIATEQKVERKRILVVEDNVELLRLIEEGLAYKGYDVTICTDGEQALRYIKRYGPFDLIYTGIVMPVISGITFLERLKRSKVKHGPVVVCSNLHTEEIIKMAYGLGAVAYLQKEEVTIDNLIHKLESLITSNHGRKRSVTKIKK